MLDFSTLGGLIGLHRQGRLSDDGYKQLAKLLMQENDRLYAKLGRAEEHARTVSEADVEPGVAGVAREFLEILEE